MTVLNSAVCGMNRKYLPVPGTKSAAASMQSRTLSSRRPHGISIQGATIYCTHTPCILCAKMLVNAKISRFVSFGKYNDNEFVQLFKEAGIDFEMKEKPSSQIGYLD